MAATRVANNTPLALWSSFFLIKIKNTIRLTMAPRLTSLPIKLKLTADLKVPSNPSLEKNKIYKAMPIILAIMPIINPTITSFLII